jgi:SAM-dependent methyltransferase
VPSSARHGGAPAARVIRLTRSPLGHEALDGDDAPRGLARAALQDIASVNALFGGRSAAAFGLDRLLADGRAGERLTLLDVGAGAGDVAAALARRARARGIHLTPVPIDSHPEAVALCRAAGLDPVRASAAALPFRPRSVDIVLASQLLHHFDRASGVALVRAFDALARRGVILAEPRRTRWAVSGIWVATLALGLHPVTRRDGVLSVRRSFTAAELGALLAEAGVAGSVHHRRGFRLVAVWRPRHADD